MGTAIDKKQHNQKLTHTHTNTKSLQILFAKRISLREHFFCVVHIFCSFSSFKTLAHIQTQTFGLFTTRLCCFDAGYVGVHIFFLTLAISMCFGDDKA